LKFPSKLFGSIILIHNFTLKLIHNIKYIINQIATEGCKMGILDKVMFWKQKDSFEGSGNLGLDHASGDPGMSHGTDPGVGHDDLGLQGSNTGMQHDSFGDNPQAFNQPQEPMQHQQQSPQSSPQSFQQSPQQGFHHYEKPTLVQPQEGGFGSQNYSTKKEFEVISAKLDALKAGIDAMNQRLATLEREIRHKRW
jgi:hypothetical protein